ncbi:zinc-binding dehydrogenase [Streptomyces sp. R41]|uniref:Zinc-binding dehydrogenase n=1 Tax=Streptomyces sp. R41 TaxID=3238632 RepID=A0AB39RP01_9ACTN
MGLETTVAVAGLLVAIVAAALAWAPQRLASRDRGVDLFVRVRSHLKSRRAELSTAGADGQTEHRADPELVLLTRPGWIPPRPLPLDTVRMTLREPRELRELVEAGKLAPVIDRTYGSLSEVPEAIRYMEVEHVRAKVVVTV